MRFSLSCVFVATLSLASVPRCVAFSSQYVGELQRDVMRIIEAEGIQNPSLPVLLKKILDVNPEDLWALGLLALRKFHDRDFKRSLTLAKRLRKMDEAPEGVRTLAGHLVTALGSFSTSEANRRASIAALRELVCALFLTEESDKTMLHGLFEHEAQELAGSYDSELAPIPGRERRWKDKLPHYVPGLHSQPFWPAAQFDLAQALEAASPVITDEVASLYNDTQKWKAVGQHTGAVDEKLVLHGTWVDLPIFSSGRFNDENCIRMPQTCNLLKKQLDLITNPPAVALVSVLQPGTEIAEHIGTTNAALTFHLGIRVPANHSAGIQVAGQKQHWQEGQVLVFDDSFNHSVWHYGRASSVPRIVLLLRVWHPEVNIRERTVALQLSKTGAGQVHSAWRDADLDMALRKLSSKKAAAMWEAQMSRTRDSIASAQSASRRVDEP